MTLQNDAPVTDVTFGALKCQLFGIWKAEAEWSLKEQIKEELDIEKTGKVRKRQNVADNAKQNIRKRSKIRHF